MKTPDITPAQIISTVLAVIGLLVAFGLNISKAEQDGIVQVITVGWPSFLAVDAIIRHGRSGVVAAQHVQAAAEISAAASSASQDVVQKWEPIPGPVMSPPMGMSGPVSVPPAATGPATPQA